MSKVRIHDIQDLIWQSGEDYSDAESAKELGDNELNTAYACHEIGAPGQPQLIEVIFQPNTVIPLHAHLEDEIIYIVHGSIKLGPRVLHAGSSIFISRNTLYTFQAGSEGLRILNFRPRSDNSYITKQMFLDARKSAVQ